MTQDEQEQELQEARRIVRHPGVTLDRSRHETTTATALWVFEGKTRHGEPAQIGSVARIEGRTTWRAQKMANGNPYTQRTEPTLAAALAHIVS